MIKRASKRKIQRLVRRRQKQKREYGKNRYHNMSEEKKQKLNEYQKKYREAKKASI